MSQLYRLEVEHGEELADLRGLHHAQALQLRRLADAIETITASLYTIGQDIYMIKARATDRAAEARVVHDSDSLRLGALEKKADGK